MSPSLGQARSPVPTPADVEGTPVVTVILRVRNEVNRVVRAVLAVDEELGDLGLPHEIVVADSASSDGTSKRALAMGLERVRVVRSDRPGRGRLLAAAIAHARGEIVALVDMERALAPAALRPAIYAVLRGAEGAIGCYTAPETAARRDRSCVLRSPVARLCRHCQRWLLGAALPRSTGVDVFRRTSLLAALRHVRTAGLLWETELLATLSHAGARLEQVPVVARPPRNPLRVPRLRPVARAGVELPGLCLRVRRQGTRLKVHRSIARVLSPAG